MIRHLISIAIALALAAPAFAASERHFLLRDSFARPDRAPKSNMKPKRQRFVEPDFTALQVTDLNRGQRRKLERLLTVSLFPGTTLSVVVDSVERNGIDADVWTGRIEGAIDSSVIIAVKDGAMTATFTTLREHYQVRPTDVGVHEVVELDASAFPDELDPTPVRDAMSSMATASADAATTFDVLVAYTAIARQSHGGAPAIQTLISNAVAATNASYANSNITQRMRLVGTTEVAYDDTQATWYTTLDLLAGTDDGAMDELHALRNQLGADAVGLIVWRPIEAGCGMGFLMDYTSANFAASAFNVTRSDCAVGNLSFAHEFGHNFGLEHDRANATGPPSLPYAYGYRDPNGQFRDVMAYNCPTGCPRVQHFSNPDVMYGGAPTGVHYLSSSAADNARALNANAATIANWRQSVNTTPVTFTNDPLVGGTTIIKAVHITELRTAINDKRTAAGLTPISTWTDASLVGVNVKAVHIAELRNALPPGLSVSAPLPATGGTALATQLQELRNLVR